MSFPTKEAAQKEAERLFAKYMPEGWKIKVWENLGWHFSFYCKHCSVYPYYWKKKLTHWRCLITSTPSHCGAGDGCWTEQVPYDKATTPMKAVSFALRDVKRYVDRMVKALESIEESTPL